MTTKTDRFPYGTKSSFTTSAEYEAVCETCGWKATTRHALALVSEATRIFKILGIQALN